MMFRQRLVLFGILVGALLFAMGCGAVTSLLNLGSTAGTVSELWSDVPKMDGLVKANLEMPVAANLMIKSFSQGKVAFIAYTTDQGPLAVRDYYSAERMTGAGWNATDMPGCMDSGTEGEVGVFCMFGRDVAGKQEALAIIASTDGGAGKTQLFFARIDTTSEEAQQ
jgi:hypothetical protein